MAQLGVQLHGGMGYVEETGAAQYARDVRVTAIYEGTNGIQAIDLVTRKLLDGGEAAFRLFDEIESGAEVARPCCTNHARKIWQATENLLEATEWLIAQEDMADRLAGATPYLRAFARVLGAHLHMRAGMGEHGIGPRTTLMRYYVDRMLPECDALLAEARCGASGLYALPVEDLAR